MSRASDVFEAHLRVGRLSGAALIVRDLLLRAVTLGYWPMTDAAPASVLVTRLDGSKVGRVRAPREPGAAESLLSQVRASLASMTVDDFVREWDLDRE